MNKLGFNLKKADVVIHDYFGIYQLNIYSDWVSKRHIEMFQFYKALEAAVPSR